jgi:PAS domain S-box-containing protein
VAQDEVVAFDFASGECVGAMVRLPLITPETFREILIREGLFFLRPRFRSDERTAVFRLPGSRPALRFAGSLLLAYPCWFQERLLWTSPSFFEVAEYHFYSALARAGAFDSATEDPRERHFEALADHHRQLEIWAENCPENFENRSWLVGAEIARIEGRTLDAELLYEQAIRSAHSNGFVHNEAIAYEVAARFYAARGFQKFADTYLLEGRYCYQRWGADGKVRQLDELYPQLREAETLSNPTSTIGVPVEHLDLATVIKVSQAVSGEMVVGKLIDTLMRTAIEHAGAERGLLILQRGLEQQIVAEAKSLRDKVAVEFRQSLPTSFELPESLLRYVARTHESVILDDASTENLFSEDQYVRRQHPRSVLCLPLVKQAQLVGVLYLENNLAPHAFTAQRLAMLELLASQAAISLDNARLYADLVRENDDRKRVEEALRVSEERWSRLAENSSAGVALLAPDGRFIAANEALQKMLGYTATELQARTVLDITYVEDRVATKARMRAASEGQGRIFRFEKRYVRKDTTLMWADVSNVFVAASGNSRAFHSTVIVDITERKRTEEELRQKEVSLREAQAALAHVSRVTTMGELAASIAHEVNQPLSGIVGSAGAGLRRLASDSPDIVEAQAAFRRIVRDGKRTADVVSRMRSLFKKADAARDRLDMNEAILEVVSLTHSEALRNQVDLRTELAADLPAVMGDRVQLQQVMVNLILNAIEAMHTVEDGGRDLLISTQQDDGDEIEVAVRDSGIGFDPLTAERIFAAFHTTKPGGLGMGLSISRSIVESHGGRLWAEVNDGPGATFRFTLLRCQ